MTVIAALRDAVVRLAAIQKGIVDTKIGERDGPATMIALRRDQSTLITEISTLMTQLDQTAMDNAGKAEGRRLFSAMRSAIATHQSNWPVSGAQPGVPGFEGSIKTMYAANEAFKAWARTVLNGE